MKMSARARLRLLCIVGLLSGCVYAPTMQQSYQFQQHPGVFLEFWGDYGYGYTSTRLVNRSTTSKCAWTARLDSRLLRPGEIWEVSQVDSPGNVGVANVLPSDPNCVNAKREHSRQPQ